MSESSESLLFEANAVWKDESVPPEYSDALDNQKADAAQVDLLDPRGTYFSEPPLTVIPIPTVDAEGPRRVFKVVGRVTMRDGATTSKNFQWWLSPDFRADEETGKADRHYQRFLLTREVYKQVYKGNPEKWSEVQSMFEGQTLGFSIIRTKAGKNFVSKIFAPRGQ